MTEVRDLGERPPRRDPDFTMHAWLKAGEVDWTCSHFGALDLLDAHGHRVAALIDAAWQYGVAADDAPRDEQPAVWWLLDNGGRHTLVYQRELYEGANWRHALWLVRQWWYLTRRLARIVWWMARGRR